MARQYIAVIFREELAPDYKRRVKITWDCGPKSGDDETLVIDGWDDYGCWIQSFGSINWANESGTNVFIPGIYTLVIWDSQKKLFDILFRQTGTTPYPVEKKGLVEIQYFKPDTWVTFFEGYIYMPNTRFNHPRRELTLNVSPRTDALKSMKADVGFTKAVDYLITDILLNIFRVVTPDLTSGDIDIRHSFEYRGQTRPTNVMITDVTFSELKMNVTQYITMNSIQTKYDLLVRLCKDFFSYAGFKGNRQAFFFNQTYRDTSPVELSENLVYDHESVYEQNFVDYVKMTYARVPNGQTVYGVGPLESSYETPTPKPDVVQDSVEERIGLWHYAGVDVGAGVTWFQSNLKCVRSGTTYWVNWFRDAVELDTSWRLHLLALVLLTYKYRSALANGRFHTFTVAGVSLQYGETFEYEGTSYNIVSLTHNFDDMSTELSAIELGNEDKFFPEEPGEGSLDLDTEADGSSVTETFSGDGTEAEYEVTGEFIPNTTKVWLNGVRQVPTEHYVELDTRRIEFTEAPAVGDRVLIDYAEATALKCDVTDLFTGDGATEDFSTRLSYISGTVRVYLNGIRQVRDVHYEEVNNREVSFTEAPATGDNIIVDYEELT